MVGKLTISYIFNFTTLRGGMIGETRFELQQQFAGIYKKYYHPPKISASSSFKNILTPKKYDYFVVDSVAANRSKPRDDGW